MIYLKKAISWAKSLVFLFIVGILSYGVLSAPFWIAWFGITLLSLSFVGVCYAFYEQYKNNRYLLAENEDLKRTLEAKK